MIRRELQYEIQSPSQVAMAANWLHSMAIRGLELGPVVVSITRPRRTQDQNAKLWPLLADVARQVQWVKNGERCHMAREEWKDLLTASLRTQSMAPGIDGGMVVLGLHTSRLTKRQFSDLVEIIYAFGNERGVVWSESAKTVYDEYLEAA